MNIQRTYTFDNDVKIQGSKLETELSNIVNTFNNHNLGNIAWDNIIMKLGNRYFKVSLAFLSDGTTPTFVYQEVTYP